MLSVTSLAGFGVGGGGATTLLTALQNAGLTTNLQLCLDAGDAASYTSGQSWLDRSGGGYDFLLGATGGSEASDPTFTGTVGNPLNAYWSFDGGDYFTYDSANETWMQNLHKNNAAFSIVAFGVFIGNALSNAHICGTAGSVTTNTGIGWDLKGGGSNTLSFYANNGSGNALSITTDNVYSSSSIQMLGISINEASGAGGGFVYANGGYAQVSGANTFDATYSSPSAGSASFTMQIMAGGNALSPAQNNAKLHCFGVWSTALTKANMDSIWSRMRGRFSI